MRSSQAASPTPFDICPADPGDELALRRLDAETWTSEVSPALLADGPFFDDHTLPADVLVAYFRESVVGYIKLRQTMSLPSHAHAHVLEILAGFVVEGVLKAEFYVDGAFADDVLMARTLSAPSQVDRDDVPRRRGLPA